MAGVVVGMAGVVVGMALVAGRARAEDEDSAPRQVFTTQRTWVWSAPGSTQRLGYVRAGQRLEVRGAERRARGCAGAFVPIEPRGYVCDDGKGVTRSADDRAYQVARILAPAPAAHLFRYVISNGAPMYRRLPNADEAKRAERDLGVPGEYAKYPWNEKHERLAVEEPLEARDARPFFLEGRGSARKEDETELVRMTAPLGTMLAVVRAFEDDGRVWLLTTDGTLVPADRTRAYRPVPFRGVALEGSATLPIAWVRRSGGPPVWIPSEEPANVADAADVRIARRHPRPRAIGEDERWVHVSIGGGTLVAYEGSRPVFATLISPGAGGVGRPGGDPVKQSTTPRGHYRIQYKYRSQTMSPQKDRPETERTFWIAEVPHAQYFRVPFALHAAYWHANFGEPMSGGCVNLSPEDASWLFQFTEPSLPPGWEAVWAGRESGLGTRLVVTR
jgi:hypothetical protein